MPCNVYIINITNTEGGRIVLRLRFINPLPKAQLGISRTYDEHIGPFAERFTFHNNAGLLLPLHPGDYRVGGFEHNITLQLVSTTKMLCMHSMAQTF